MASVPAADADSSVAFCKYDKMGEDSGLIGAAAISSGDNQYIITEKVHGANFCIIASFHDVAGTAVEVRFAKRTAILGGVEDSEDFYSCRSAGLLRTLRPCAERVLRRSAAERGDAVRAVHIYGELFGGSYPHPQVSALPALLPVQAGCWYSPRLEFMAFDVAIETGCGRLFLDFGLAKLLCESCGLLFAQPLFQGTLSECLDFPVEFDTTLPARLGLPPLPQNADCERNLAEGVVVRPSREPVARRHGSVQHAKESVRGLFKQKIPAFSEKRYQNDAWKKGKAGGAGGAPNIGDEELVLMEVTALVTEQRLANVLSKIGRVDPDDQTACRQLLHDFKQDVEEALEDADLQALRSSLAIREAFDKLSRRLITRQLIGRGCKAKMVG